MLLMEGGQMGVFSNLEIKSAIKEGHIICVPFSSRHVSHASLDVTLGNYYYRTERSKDHPVYNPFDERDVKRYFEGAIKAIPHKQWCDENGLKPLKGIPLSHPVIPVRPGERILTHTHEFFGIKPPGACEVRSRSRPEDMLPKAYKDKRSSPQIIRGLGV
jgi:deoxycytidine triphosphate deaminase